MSQVSQNESSSGSASSSTTGSAATSSTGAVRRSEPEAQLLEAFQRLALTDVQQRAQHVTRDELALLLQHLRDMRAREPQPTHRRIESMSLCFVLWMLLQEPPAHLSLVQYTAYVAEVSAEAARLNSLLRDFSFGAPGESK